MSTQQAPVPRLHGETWSQIRREKKRREREKESKPITKQSPRKMARTAAVGWTGLGCNRTRRLLTEEGRRRVDCEETEVSSSQRPACPLLRQRPRSTSPVERTRGIIEAIGPVLEGKGTISS